MDKILVVGSLNMDLVAVSPRLPRPGETLAGGHYFMTPGGKGANQAYAASLLGGKVQMIGKVGADDFGNRLIANLVDAGCDVTGITTSDDQSGIAMIMVSEQGENCIIIIAGANGRFVPADIEAAKPHFDDAKLLLLQLETPLETVVAAAREAKRRGALVMLDPAPAPTDTHLSALFGYPDIITPNESEAAQLVGKSCERLAIDDARTIAGDIRARGIESVIIKLGAQGCLLVDGDHDLLVPAPSVSVVDSTGAGDVFNGALSVALAEGRDMVSACRFAVSAASLSVTKMGAQASMPTMEALNLFRNTLAESSVR